MKFKKRLKSALYSFFKEEINEYLNVDKITQVTYKVEELETKRFSTKVVFERDQNSYAYVPAEHKYRKAIYNAKLNLFHQIQDYFIINKSELLNDYSNQEELFTIDLFVMKNKD